MSTENIDDEIPILTETDTTNYDPSQYVEETDDIEEQNSLPVLSYNVVSSISLDILDNTEEETPITYVKSISSAKDRTSDNGNNYSMMRKIFYSQNNNNKQNKFNDSSSYIQNKKMIATGRQSLNNNVSFFTDNNHLEIKKAKRLLRSRGSGIPKKNIQ